MEIDNLISFSKKQYTYFKSKNSRCYCDQNRKKRIIFFSQKTKQSPKKTGRYFIASGFGSRDMVEISYELGNKIRVEMMRNNNLRHHFLGKLTSHSNEFDLSRDQYAELGNAAYRTIKIENTSKELYFKPWSFLSKKVECVNYPGMAVHDEGSFKW